MPSLMSREWRLIWAQIAALLRHLVCRSCTKEDVVGIAKARNSIKFVLSEHANITVHTADENVLSLPPPARVNKVRERENRVALQFFSQNSTVLS